MTLNSQILESRSVLLQTNLSRCFWVHSTRCNHLERWKISIFIVVLVFFILCGENAFFILKTTQNESLVLVFWKYKGRFFKTFFLKMADLENDNNCKLSFVQTLSELFSLFSSYDARLLIKMYIQGFLRALITNLLSDLQIPKWRIKYGGESFEKNPIFWWK